VRDALLAQEISFELQPYANPFWIFRVTGHNVESEFCNLLNHNQIDKAKKSRLHESMAPA
jgi:hypothetical protein